MTVSRLREQRISERTESEERAQSVASLANMVSGGFGWTDPAAIPPPNMDRLQRAGVVITEQTLLQVDVVFTALRIITTAILKMGNPRAYKEELWEPDNLPYRQYLAKQPKLLTNTWGGPWQYDGRRKTVMSMGLYGEAWWYTLAFNKLGYAEALEVLHPAFLEIKINHNTGAKEYWYGPAGKQTKLDPDLLTHIPMMSMPQANRGLNPLVYMSVSGALAMAAYEFGNTWFSQGSSPSYFLTTDRKLQQPEIDRIADKFMVEKSGLQNAHLPVVLDNGMKPERVLNTPDEAQYLTTLEYARNVISSWFGIPIALIPNALERQSLPGAHTAQEEAMRFLMYTLSGYTIPMEEALESLLPKGQRVAHIEDGLSRPDTQFLAQEIMALRTTGVASKNELRVRKLHYPPSTDPDADELGAPMASNVSPDGTNGEKDSQPQPEKKSRRSKAPEPPDYADPSPLGEDKVCGGCKMFDAGVCWGYGNKKVTETAGCDSWGADA